MAQQNSHIPVAIVGANGYSGRELARLLLKHPNVKLIATFTRDPNWLLSDELPETNAKNIAACPLANLAEQANKINTLFLATPHEVSMTIASEMIDKIPNIIDLSGAFRLEENQYPAWYDLNHSAAHLLPQAHYGLCPWNSKKTSKLIANPGCYATAVLMALLPLIKHGLIDPQHIVIDAKSGLTGAGRKPKANLLFSEIAQDFYPYKIGYHQHQPEIDKTITELTGQQVNVMMITHLLPVKRGISASLYLTLVPHIASLPKDEIIKKVTESFDQAYQNYPLIQYGHVNTVGGAFLSLNKVVGSCRTHVAYEVKGDKLLVFSTIDNLLKGAASQAIENFNCLHQLPIATALQQQEGVL